MFTFSINCDDSDKEPPQISSCPSDVTTRRDLGHRTAVVSWSHPHAVDNTESNPVVACTPDSSGYKFTIGITEVVCEAIDSNGNIAKCVFTVNVTGLFLVCKGKWDNSGSGTPKTFHAAGVSRLQVKNVTKMSKMSKLWNFMPIYEITMRNVFK